MQGVTPEAVFPVAFPTGTMVEAEGAVWLFDWTGVTRVDPATNEATRYPLESSDGADAPSVVAAVGFGSLWVSDFDGGEVRKYDLTGGTPVDTISTPNPGELLVFGDDLWLANHHTGSVSRIDPSTGEKVATISLGRSGSKGPGSFGVMDDRIWVTVANEGTVAGIDPATDQSIGSIPVEAPGVPCGGIGSFE